MLLERLIPRGTLGQNDAQMKPRPATPIGSRLVDALQRDPPRGWEAVLVALPALGIAGPDARALAREIRAHIRLRRRWQRLRREHP